jgi:hypothetical protein
MAVLAVGHYMTVSVPAGGWGGLLAELTVTSQSQKKRTVLTKELLPSAYPLVAGTALLSNRGPRLMVKTTILSSAVTCPLLVSSALLSSEMFCSKVRPA